MRNDFASRAVRALDRLHRARFKCGRAPTGNDGVHVRDAYDVCKLRLHPVDIGEFVARGILLNAVAEAIRVGVLEVVEVKQ